MHRDRELAEAAAAMKSSAELLMAHGRRKGNWMATFSGKRFYPLDPRYEDIEMIDIAHALSNLCRYTGHCRQFYSVAEHCVIGTSAMARRLTMPKELIIENQKLFLLHDAAEAYMNDLCRPVKKMPEFRQYEEAEYGLQNAINRRFHLPLDPLTYLPVSEMDNVMLATEAKILFSQTDGWFFPEPHDPRIKLGCWNPNVARERFMMAWETLSKGQVFELPAGCTWLKIES